MMSNSFELVSQNLKNLGAIPVHEYIALMRPAGVQLETEATRPSAGLFEELGMDIDEDQEELNDEQSMKAIRTDFVEDEDVLAIEHACEGRCARPTWVYYCPLDADTTVQWGAALRVQLPLLQFYATDQIYATQNKAKSACAQIAISEGVLKAIKALPPSLQSLGVVQESFCDMSLSMWFDKLPRPLPSFFDDKVLTEIHGAVVLDYWAAKARGARLKMHYYFPTFGQQAHRLYGCVLRINRPKECRSFFVDPVFSKRFDAKTAVCLLAISLGVEDYYLSVANEIANIITPGLRVFANEQILPVLNQMAPGDTRHYSYSTDRNAFGCTLTVGVGPDEIVYCTESEFSSKNDAKTAVLLIAAANGLIEFINYGHTPRDFQARWAAVETQVSGMPIVFTTPTKRKRDHAEPQPIPVMKESRNLKKKRKQAHAVAIKKCEDAALFNKDATSRTSHSSSAMPCEKFLTKITSPFNGGSLPFASSAYVQIPYLHEQAGTCPPPLWGYSSLDSNSMDLQSYSHYSHLPTKDRYGYMDHLSQDTQHRYGGAGPW